jgi:uncharacterized membrane protein
MKLPDYIFELSTVWLLITALYVVISDYDWQIYYLGLSSGLVMLLSYQFFIGRILKEVEKDLNKHREAHIRLVLEKYGKNLSKSMIENLTSTDKL